MPKNVGPVEGGSDLDKEKEQDLANPKIKFVLCSAWASPDSVATLNYWGFNLAEILPPTVRWYS